MNLVDNAMNNWSFTINKTVKALAARENQSLHATSHISLRTLDGGGLQLKLCKISAEANIHIEGSTKTILYCNCHKSVDVRRDVVVRLGSSLLNMHLFHSFQICHNVNATNVSSNKPSESKHDFSSKTFHHFKKLRKPSKQDMYPQRLTNQTTLT